MLSVDKKINCRAQLDEWLDYELFLYGEKECFLPITEGAVLNKHQYLLRKDEYCTNISNKVLKLFYKARLYR